MFDQPIVEPAAYRSSRGIVDSVVLLERIILHVVQFVRVEEIYGKLPRARADTSDWEELPGRVVPLSEPVDAVAAHLFKEVDLIVPHRLFEAGLCIALP